MANLPDEDEVFLPLNANDVCNRMGLGTEGTNCEMVTNTFLLRFTPEVVYRYVVEYEPEIPPERIKQRKVVKGMFRAEIQAHFGEDWFDGTTMLTLKKAANSQFGPSPSGHSIAIRFIKEVSTDAKNQGAQEVNTIMNVISKKYLRRLGMLSIGRSYFYPEPKPLQVRYAQGTPQEEQFRMKIFSGFNVSIQPCLRGNLMCIDLVSRVMQEASVRKVMNITMKQVRASGGSREQYYEALNRLLVGRTVYCMYNGRTWRIDRLDFTKTMLSTFTVDAPDGRPVKENTPRARLGAFTGDISFRDYFSRCYPEITEKKLLPPAGHQACNEAGLLVNEPTKSRTTLKTTILLPELCYLTGLDDKMRSNQSLMKALNTETRLAPSKRVAAISDLIKKVHDKGQEVERKLIERFPEKSIKLPMVLDQAPLTTQGRVLGNFDISFPRGKTTLKENKSFSNDIRKCGFFDGQANVGNFACVFLEDDKRNAQTISQTMTKLASQQGARLGQCTVKQIGMRDAKNANAWTAALNSAIASKPAFVLILNPRADTFVYSVVKNVCTVTNHVVSQVMDSTKVQGKMVNPICGNTLKQILAKLGYQNWRVNIGRFLPPSEQKSTMFVGMDVCHDKLLKGVYGGSRGNRSTVGWCASRNPTYHSYNSYISYQDPNTEFITEGKRLMRESLQDYQRENKAYPTSVCIYRDGVGDSQLTTFVRREIIMYKEAFESLNITPKLTVIVVQKRVNLRLFTACPVHARQANKCPIENRCSGRDKYHSPMSGTIVDNDITSKILSDFYLVPSIAPPGATARPTRFVVMKDDIGFTKNVDALQNMTNQMCYQYFNWPGPIRVPACVMYAHKAAYLFGKHVTGAPHNEMRKNLFYL